MVNKIFIDDPYRGDCTATVTNVLGNKVLLSDTVFYPEGGGQVGDTGWISESRVVDTQKYGGRPFVHPTFPDMIMINGDVTHTLAEDTAVPEIGAEVDVRVDWERRLANMRHHSAGHLGFLFATTARPDLYIKGARIDDKTARFDFHTRERLSTDEVAEWEGRANEMIDKDLEIHVLPVDGEHEARVWYSGDLMIPCGGTHVRSTGQIGRVRMRRKRQGNSLERLYISIVELNAPT